MPGPKIRLMVVDDSAVVRQVLSAIFNADPDIELLGAYADPLFAQKAMAVQWPDVITLDVEMPRMDGISFLRQIMATRPTPVVICSTLTTKGAPTTLEAMRAGAVDIVEKPTQGLRDHLQSQATKLVMAVKTAARANVKALALRSGAASPGSGAGASPRQAPSSPMAEAASAAQLLQGTSERGYGAMVETTDRLIAIGTSTGGTQALEFVLTQLPRTVPGIVIVQHMPENFTQAFADRLNSICDIRVKQAEDGERVLAGQALIAPGGRHLQIRRNGAYYYAQIKDGPPVSRHRPSVNVLFNSVASQAGRNAIGIIMTGMGDDGARGLLEMRQAGAVTWAQDEASCVVFGMPKEAIKIGGATHVVGLDEIPNVISGKTLIGRTTNAAA